MHRLGIATLTLLACGCQAHQSERALLDRAVVAWNKGDLASFMDCYWRSAELTFSSGGQTRRGWQQTYEHYRRSYPTPERMGQLAFSDLEFRHLGPTATLALGRWRLQRAADAPGGNFSLVLQKFDHRWVISHDHTSVDPALHEAN